MVKWTDDMIGYATELRAGGRSSSQIAEAVNEAFGTGFTRNSVIGALDRLAKRGGMPMVNVSRVLPKTQGGLNGTNVQKALKFRERNGALVDKVLDMGVSFDDLSARSCRWELHDCDDTNVSVRSYRFCGERTTAAGKPYCADHALLVYIPSRINPKTHGIRR